MRKTHAPFRLTHYEIHEGKATKKAILQELTRMSTWMRAEQEHYFKNDMNRIIQEFHKGEIFTGSLNSLGRTLNIQPYKNYPHNAYNMSEMLRTSVLARTAGQIQDAAICEIINKDNQNDTKKIIQDFKNTYPHLKKPTEAHTTAVAKRLIEKGVIAGEPAPDGIINLSATDTHYCKITRDNRNLYLTIRSLGELGRVVLKFRIPKSDRFSGGKITRPNIAIKNGEPVFYFTVQHEIETLPYNSRVLGVDLGKIEEYVATIVDGNEMSYSAPYYARKKVKSITEQMDKLWRQYNSNKYKKEMNEKFGHLNRASIHKTECQRIRSRITRLKNERALTIAAHLVEVAERNGVSLISVEQLSWLGSKGGKWEHSAIQNAMENRGRRSGIGVRKVSARGTSTHCSKCNKEARQSGRFVICDSCGLKLNRDVSASRKVGVRAIPNATKQFNHYKQVLSVMTRSSRRVTMVPSPYLQSVTIDSQESKNCNNLE